MSVESFINYLENQGFIYRTYDHNFLGKYYELYNVADEPFVFIYNKAELDHLLSGYSKLGNIIGRITIIKSSDATDETKFIPYIKMDDFLNSIDNKELKKFCLFNLDCFA